MLIVMFSLAVGALAGDAILHLLPMVFGAHLHGAGDVHDHEEDWDYLWKVSFLLVVLYSCYAER
jgi:hypothetical protein